MIDGPNDLTFTYDAAERVTRIRETGTGFTSCSTNWTSGPRCLKEFTYGNGERHRRLSARQAPGLQALQLSGPGHHDLHRDRQPDLHLRRQAGRGLGARDEPHFRRHDHRALQRELDLERPRRGRERRLPAVQLLAVLHRHAAADRERDLHQRLPDRGARLRDLDHLPPQRPGERGDAREQRHRHLLQGPVQPGCARTRSRPSSARRPSGAPAPTPTTAPAT